MFVSHCLIDSSLCRGLVYNMKHCIPLSFRRIFRKCLFDPMEGGNFDILEDSMPSPIMSIEPHIEYTVLVTEYWPTVISSLSNQVACILYIVYTVRHLVFAPVLISNK